MQRSRASRLHDYSVGRSSFFLASNLPDVLTVLPETCQVPRRLRPGSSIAAVNVTRGPFAPGEVWNVTVAPWAWPFISAPLPHRTTISARCCRTLQSTEAGFPRKSGSILKVHLPARSVCSVRAHPAVPMRQIAIPTITQVGCILERNATGGPLRQDCGADCQAPMSCPRTTQVLTNIDWNHKTVRKRSSSRYLKHPGVVGTGAGAHVPAIAQAASIWLRRCIAPTAAFVAPGPASRAAFPTLKTVPAPPNPSLIA